jgi:hypothetical protein
LQKYLDLVPAARDERMSRESMVTPPALCMTICMVTSPALCMTFCNHYHFKAEGLLYVGYKILKVALIKSDPVHNRAKLNILADFLISAPVRGKLRSILV